MRKKIAVSIIVVLMLLFCGCAPEVSQQAIDTDAITDTDVEDSEEEIPIVIVWENRK